MNACDKVQCFSRNENSNKCVYKLGKCTCFHTNADQLMNKRTEFKATIDSYSPDIIGIMEVKPKNSRYNIEDCEIAIERYDLLHNLDSEGRSVALYTKKDLKATLCENILNEFKESILWDVNWVMTVAC